MLHAECVGLLLEIDDIDIHGIKAERKGQFDQFAGTSGERQAHRAKIAKHLKRVLLSKNSPAENGRGSSMTDSAGILKVSPQRPGPHPLFNPRASPHGTAANR